MAAHAAAMPLVSVVMPTLNHAAFIGQAIESVLGQLYPRLELLVQDAGSTDGTIEMLERMRAGDSRLQWVSAPDKGPADGVNKAISRARGTVIGWLNSDDLYTQGALERAVGALLQHPDWLAVYGHGLHVDDRGRVIDRYPTKPPQAACESFLDGCFICQPALLFRRSLFTLLGPLDGALRTAFDFDYWLRLFKWMPHRVGFIDEVQAHSRLHARGITRRMRREVALEGLAVLKRHLGQAPLHWALTHVAEIRAGAKAGGNTDEEAEIARFVRDAQVLLSPSDAQRLRIDAGGVRDRDRAGFN